MHRGNERRARSLTVVGLLAALVAVAALAAGCGGTEADEQAAAGKGTRDKLVIVRQVTFRTAVDGSTVKGLFAVPRAVPSNGCLIFQSGFRSNKEASSSAWQGFAALGISVFSLDFRYHGERAADSSTYDRVLRDPDTFARMIRETVGDFRSAIDFLEKQSACKKTVAYAGVSLGGGIGTILAARDKRIKALALIVTPGRWSLAFRAPESPFPRDFANTRAKRIAAGKVYDPLNPDRFIAKVAPRPVLILSGDRDRTVVPASSRALQRAARAPKTILNFRGGHDVAASGDATEAADTLASFFLRTITQPRYGIKGESNGTFFQP